MAQGTLPVRELSHASVFDGIVNPSEEGAVTDAPLDQLQTLSKSVVFKDIWINAGNSVLRKLNGMLDEVPSSPPLIEDINDTMAVCDLEDSSMREECVESDCEVVESLPDAIREFKDAFTDCS